MNDTPNTKATSESSEIRVLTMKINAYAIFFFVSSVTILSIYFFTDTFKDASSWVYLVIIVVMFIVIYFATKTRKALERARSDSQY